MTHLNATYDWIVKTTDPGETTGKACKESGKLEGEAGATSEKMMMNKSREAEAFEVGDRNIISSKEKS